MIKCSILTMPATIYVSLWEISGYCGNINFVTPRIFWHFYRHGGYCNVFAFTEKKWEKSKRWLSFLAFYWHFIVAFHLSLCVSIFFTLSVVVLQTIISSSVFSCLLEFSLLFISQHCKLIFFFLAFFFYLYVVFLWNSFTILLFLASKVTVFLIYRILCASQFLTSSIVLMENNNNNNNNLK